MILIADDSINMRTTLKDILQEFDDSFFECSNGVEALEIYGVLQPDLVLMDIKMPVMDGITATRNIVQRYPKARIIIVSNYNDPILRNEAESAGAIGYVLKDDLSELQRFLSNSSKR